MDNIDMIAGSLYRVTKEGPMMQMIFAGEVLGYYQDGLFENAYDGRVYSTFGDEHELFFMDDCYEEYYVGHFRSLDPRPHLNDVEIGLVRKRRKNKWFI